MASSRSVYRKLYLIGDSNVQFAFSNGGFASRLSNDYVRRLDVVNRGFSGYTSEHVRAMTRQLLDNDNHDNNRIHTATVLLGSNDSVLPELDSRHVTPARYRENLEAIVACLREGGVANIVLLSPPPVDDVKWNKRVAELYNAPGACCNASVAKYAEVCRTLAKQLGVGLVDLYGEMMKCETWRDMFGDGLHFNERGNEFVYERLKEVLGPLLGEVASVYPDWKDREGMDKLMKL